MNRGLFLDATLGSTQIPNFSGLRLSRYQELGMHLGAAIFGHKSNQIGCLAPVHRMINEATGAPRSDQSGASQRIEVMR
jgi:hypothetical protein